MANSIKSTTPTLKDAAALSQMLVHVAKQDQHYTGDKALTLSATNGGLLVTEHGTAVGDDGCAVSADGVDITNWALYPTPHVCTL